MSSYSSIKLLILLSIVNSKIACVALTSSSLTRPQRLNHEFPCTHQTDSSAPRRKDTQPASPPVTPFSPGLTGFMGLPAWELLKQVNHSLPQGPELTLPSCSYRVCSSQPLLGCSAPECNLYVALDGIWCPPPWTLSEIVLLSYDYKYALIPKYFQLVEFLDDFDMSCLLALFSLLLVTIHLFNLKKKLYITRPFLVFKTSKDLNQL